MSPGSQTAEKAGLNPQGLDEKIRQLCGLFVFIQNSKIYLVHQTAREFLIDRQNKANFDRKWSFDASDAEKLMAQICVRYLLMKDLCNGQQSWIDQTQSFLAYSAEYWPDHIRKMPQEALSELEEQLYELYNVNSPRYALWFPLFWEAAMKFRAKPRMDSIHLAAFNGHAGVIRELIKRTFDNGDKTEHGGTTALQWASRSGYLEVVQILLQHRANVNAQGGAHGTALQAASRGGHVEVVKLLLVYGANINALSWRYGTALQAASEGAHIYIVRILLEAGANVNTNCGPYGSPLQAASRGGHVEVVELLLKRGADVNGDDGRYNSALQTASLGGHIETVKVLLNNGANINAQGGRYGSAFQAASVRGYVEVVRVLLEKGANISASGGAYGTPVRAASTKGHLDVVKILSEWGSV